MAEDDSLLQFPCEYTLKVMGKNCDAFEVAVLDIVHRHVPNLSEGALSTKLSRKGKYTSLSISFTAQSKQQVDNIYMDLSNCDLVIMSL